MENPEIQKIITLLTEAYVGPAWHGPSVLEVLRDLSFDQVTKSVGDSHNIAEIVYHMIAWRTFLIKKLKGFDNYDVSDEANFQQFEDVDEKQWEALKNRLEENQKELIALLNNTEDRLLIQKVNSKNYNFYILIQGVIQHDLYHLGQIVLIKKHG